MIQKPLWFLAYGRHCYSIVYCLAHIGPQRALSWWNMGLVCHAGTFPVYTAQVSLLDCYTHRVIPYKYFLIFQYLKMKLMVVRWCANWHLACGDIWRGGRRKEIPTKLNTFAIFRIQQTETQTLHTNTLNLNPTIFTATLHVLSS